MNKSWSLYGAAKPRWLLLLTWLLVLALPIVVAVAMQLQQGHVLILGYSLAGGVFVLGSALWQRSWLLLVQGVYMCLTYLYLAFPILGFAP